MRVLIVGLGSIGRRHLRNLRTAGVTDFVLCHTGRGTLPENELSSFARQPGTQVSVEGDLGAALAHRPQAAVIANPTALHLPAAQAAAEAGCHLLVEKPLSHSMTGVDDLAAVVRRKRLTTLVGYQYRFHAALLQVKALLAEQAIGRVLHAYACYGEYLPGMHPWEDFRGSYSAREDLGGGVLMTLCHPVDYLRWFFGEITGVMAAESLPRPFGLAVDGCFDLLLRGEAGPQILVHLDYLRKPRSHCLAISGEGGTITWDEGDNTVHLHTHVEDRHEAYPPPDGYARNDMFLSEAKHFVTCLRQQEEPAIPLQEGKRVLEILLAIRRAAEERRMVDV